jgi:Leucine-rich repeat (LRR) protein
MPLHSTFFLIFPFFLLFILTGCSEPLNTPAANDTAEVTETVKKFLKLDNEDVDDTALANICEKQPQLVELTLGNTKITDKGLADLGKLKNLKKLRLSKTAITNTGIAALAACTTLEDIDISQTQAGDAAVKTLATLSRLKKINLYKTLVSDKGIENFAGQPAAETVVWLNLDKTPFTDKGIPFLKAFTKLEWLHIGSTFITDKGLKELPDYLPKTLKDVYITKTETSPEAVAQLRNAVKESVPECKIHDNLSENTPQGDIDEAREHRKTIVQFTGESGK